MDLDIDAVPSCVDMYGIIVARIWQEKDHSQPKKVHSNTPLRLSLMKNAR
jgi:hypothetical protein